MDNYYGQLQVPVLGIRLEQLILILYPTLLVPAVFLWYRHMQARKTAAIEPPGCVKLGLRGRSNMADQYDSKYDTGTQDPSQWKVKAIHIHPIKSCAPVELDEAEIHPSGINWDRKFFFAELLQHRDPLSKGGESSYEWTFRTLRTSGFEKLAFVRPEVWVPKTSPKNPDNLQHVRQTGALVIRFPHLPIGPLAALDNLFIRLGLLPRELSFQVPLIPPTGSAYPRETIRIMEDRPTWLNMSVHVPDSFRSYIGAKNPLTLFRVDPDVQGHRKVWGNAPSETELGYQVTHGATDDYPLQLLNIASVHELAHRVEDSIPRFNARRFRSNFIISGPPAFDEDSWKKIEFSRTVDGTKQSHLYYCPARTTRCKLPNVDPDTSARHPSEPDKTMRTFRCIDEGMPKKACMGMFLVPADLKATGGKVKIAVGDTIEVVERGEHFFLPPNQKVT